MSDNQNGVLDCLILGGGPAGMSCALYCARGGLKTAVLDTSMFGGAPVNYFEIENYLGFSRVSGQELASS
ncbi:NAD(P)/FAD-dependent oxidoreductase, partial [bacterium]|nr:NAD(P)/FAD-dependent oxidoreductase [bacterium]